MKYSVCSEAKQRQFLASSILLVLVLKTINPYFLSFGVPAKHGIAKDLIETNDIGRKAVAGFIDYF